MIGLLSAPVRWHALWVALVAMLLLLPPASVAFVQDSATAEAPAPEVAEQEDSADQDREQAAGAAEEKKEEKAKENAAKAKQDKSETKVRFAQVVLTQDLPESPGVMSLFGDLQLDLRSTLARLDRAAKDDNIDGLVLEIRDLTIGRGKTHELCEAIHRFRSQGKKVYAQLEMATTGDYLVAAACDEIVMPESGMLVVPGVRAEAMFYKGALDMLGIKSDFIHMGEAKGAAEPFTRRRFSKPVRENMTALVDDLYEHLVETIAFERPITKEQAIAAIDEGLLTATRAKQLGLIDRIAYPNELRSQLGKSYQTDKLVYVQNYGKKKVDTDFSGPSGFLKLFSMMAGGSGETKAKGKKIALVYAVGAITTGESTSDLFGVSTLGSTTLVKALREAADDDEVAAIVLRIDSPGGSAVASDLVWSQMEQIEKPVVASMGDVAASGGYYIAMGADKIFAEPATVTGSIGVVGGKIALGGLFNRVGLNVETISRGKNSGVFSLNKKFTASERETVRTMMEDTYEQFTSKAAAGRDMPLDQLKKLAGGKVYTGRQAKANGLIDEIGTLHDAIAEAKKLAGLDPDEDVKFKTLPEPVDFFESLFGNTDAEKEVGVQLGLDRLSPQLVQLARRLATLQRVFREPVALVMPFDLTIE